MAIFITVLLIFNTIGLVVIAVLLKVKFGNKYWIFLKAFEALREADEKMSAQTSGSSSS